MEEKILLIGIVLIFVGIILTIISAFLSNKRVEYGFGGFIGPIPFGWATNQKMLMIIVILMMIFLLYMLILR